MKKASKAINVAVISETDKTVKGHGVHTAFVDMLHEYAKRKDIYVSRKISPETDVIHIHTTGPLGFKAIRKKKPRVVSAHIVPDSLKGSLALTWLWLPFYAAYLKWIYNKADILIAHSPYTVDELRKWGITTRTEFIPLGVNRNKFNNNKPTEEFKESLGIPKDSFVFICVGQIQPRKGVSDFIEVAKKIPEATFLWVGGRPFGRLTSGYDEMTSLMKSAPKNVIFTGSVEYKDMPKYYAGADIFFFPSLQETFGLVITEAASMGLPIVLRDLDIYKKLFLPYYRSGSNVEEFSEILKQLMNNSDEHAKQQKQSEELAEKYSFNKAVEKMRKLYVELIQNE